MIEVKLHEDRRGRVLFDGEEILLPGIPPIGGTVLDPNNKEWKVDKVIMAVNQLVTTIIVHDPLKPRLL